MSHRPQRVPYIEQPHIDGAGAQERSDSLCGVVLLPGQERHDTGEHPENTLRLPGVITHLQSLDWWRQLQVLYPRTAQLEDLARSHTDQHIQTVASAAASSPAWLDGDTPVSEGSFEVARLAAGAALQAVDRLTAQAGRAESLFALIRPPGHHALAERAMGFCLFNNASIAARYAQEVCGLQRVAILDWDVHHGNGTQAIHYSDPSVLYISLHQSPLYPGTGSLEETGCGDGEGYNINLPLPRGCGDHEYLAAFEQVIQPLLHAYHPQLLIISAGQDCHAGDELANQMVSALGLREMSARMAALCAEMKIGLLALHEGGYNLATLPHLDAAVLAGLGGFDLLIEDIHGEKRTRVEGFSEHLREIRASTGRYWSDLR